MRQCYSMVKWHIVVIVLFWFELDWYAFELIGRASGFHISVILNLIQVGYSSCSLPLKKPLKREDNLLTRDWKRKKKRRRKRIRRRKEQHFSTGRTSSPIVIWAPPPSCAVPGTAGWEAHHPSETSTKSCPINVVTIGQGTKRHHQKYHQSSERQDLWVSPSQSRVSLKSSYHTQRNEEQSRRASNAVYWQTELA